MWRFKLHYANSDAKKDFTAATTTSIGLVATSDTVAAAGPGFCAGASVQALVRPRNVTLSIANTPAADNLLLANKRTISAELDGKFVCFHGSHNNGPGETNAIWPVIEPV